MHQIIWKGKAFNIFWGQVIFRFIISITVSYVISTGILGSYHFLAHGGGGVVEVGGLFNYQINN